MNKLDKTIKNFLFPDFFVEEVLLSSFLVIVSVVVFSFSFLFNLNFRDYIFDFFSIKSSIDGLFTFVFFLGIIAYYSLKSLLRSHSVLRSKIKEVRRLKAIQNIGLVFDLWITVLFIIVLFKTRFFLVDYFFIFYAVKIFVRMLILLIVFKEKSENLKGTIFDDPISEAKHMYIPLKLVYLVLFISSVVFVFNINNILLALGYSYFIGLMLFDLIKYYKQKS